jgi:hypothetical protein
MGACAGLSIAAPPREPVCDDSPVALPKAASEIKCGRDEVLADVLKDYPLARSKCLVDVMATAQALNKERGFGFRVIYRPARPEDHGRILEINPHARADVKVCATHEIDVYVGRWPFRQMPKPAFTGRSISQAEKELQDLGFKPELRCADGESELSNKALPVTSQWPQPGKLLGAHVPIMSGFVMPDQQPLLFAECASKKLPECQQLERCPLPPDPSPPDGPRSDSSSGDVALGGAAGLAGGLLLARVLRGQTPAPPAPRDVPPTRSTIVRVRHDLDPAEPSEARGDPDDT